MGSIPSLTHPQEGPLRRKCREGSYLNVSCLESPAGREDEPVRPRVSVSSGAVDPEGGRHDSGGATDGRGPRVPE